MFLLTCTLSCFVVKCLCFVIIKLIINLTYKHTDSAICKIVFDCWSCYKFLFPDCCSNTHYLLLDASVSMKGTHG